MEYIKSILAKIRTAIRRVFRRISNACGRSVFSDKCSPPDARLDELERWSGRATLLILAGILLDIVVALRSSQQSWELIGTIAANILIGVGLILEYIIIGRAIVAGGEAKRLSNEWVAAAEVRAAEAMARAAEATERAAAADLARVQLEGSLAWRMLNTEQQGRITAKMVKFGGTLFSVVVPEHDLEAANLAAQLRKALEVASWSFFDVGPLPWLDSGVSVETAYSSANKVGSAAKELVDAINAEGISTKQVIAEKYEGRPPAIFVIVGKKPPTAVEIPRR